MVELVSIVLYNLDKGGNMKNGKLIVVEGACDGIGKSTQYTLLKERLESDGKVVVNHHFPTYEEVQGTFATNYLKGEYGNPNELSPYFINNLYALDRSITWLTKLKKAYEEGKIILLDRYTTSSLIYQSCLIEDIDKKKEFIDWVVDYEYNKLGIPKPDLVIFLTADFDLVMQMKEARKVNDGVSNDIHESNNEFMKKVYDSALFVADYLNWDVILCDQDGQMKSIEDIHEEVFKRVKAL